MSTVESAIASPPDHRSALALLEAILPGSASIPPADETTLARAIDVMTSFEPRVAKAWLLAQRTLCTAAVAFTGRRFEDLSASAQDALLARWEATPILKGPLSAVSLVYKLVHFDRATRDQPAGALRVVGSADEARWQQRVQPLGTWTGGDVECDVVVVGSGAGGAVVARELADRGHAVVLLEEGEYQGRAAFDGSAVRAHQRFFRAAFTVGNAPMPIMMGRLVGGSTAVNGGTCFRTPPWVLDRWCEEIGVDDFAPDAMRPHFERVERILEVAPTERRLAGPIADVMARGCNRLGWSHFPIQRNAPGCDGSGFCDFGCPSEAKRGTHIAYIPPALERGAMLFTGARAEQILLDGQRAAGVLARAADGRALRVRARAVVLAGGAVSTPLLLLAQGLCNRSGEVGRNLTVHPSGGFSALFGEEIRGHAHVPQGYGCDQFARDGILIMSAQPDRSIAALALPFTGRRLTHALEGADRTAGFALMIADASRNGRVWRNVAGFPAIRYDLAEADVRKMHNAMVRTGEMCLAAGARRLYPLVLGTRPIDDAAALGAFRETSLAASDIVWVSYHPLGTCKMGLDPRTSVVGVDHQTHDIRGLYVVDGSTVPGPLGVNPQITIMAMATRAASVIADRL